MNENEIKKTPAQIAEEKKAERVEIIKIRLSEISAALKAGPKIFELGFLMKTNPNAEILKQYNSLVIQRRWLEDELYKLTFFEARRIPRPGDKYRPPVKEKISKYFQFYI